MRPLAFSGLPSRWTSLLRLTLAGALLLTAAPTRSIALGHPHSSAQASIRSETMAVRAAAFRFTGLTRRPAVFVAVWASAAAAFVSANAGDSQGPWIPTLTVAAISHLVSRFGVDGRLPAFAMTEAVEFGAPKISAEKDQGLRERFSLFRKRLSRRALLIGGAAGTPIGLGVLGIVCAPVIQDTFDALVPPKVDATDLKRRLNDALDRITAMPLLNDIRFPAGLALTRFDAMAAFVNLKAFVNKARMIPLYHRQDRIIFAVNTDAEGTFKVNLRYIDDALVWWPDLFHHEGLHLSPYQLTLGNELMAAGRDLAQKIEAHRRRNMDFDEAVKGAGPFFEIVAVYATWFPDEIKGESGDRIMTALSSRFRRELESYTGNAAFFSAQAREANLPLTSYIDKRIHEARQRHSWSPTYWARQFRTWLGHPTQPPPDVVLLESFKSFFEHYDDRVLTTGYLNAVIRYMTLLGDNTHHAKVIEQIARQRYRADFRWDQLKGDDDPATEAFFAWLRPQIFRLSPSDIHPNTRSPHPGAARPVAAAA